MHTAMRTTLSQPAQIVSRVAAGLLGSYAFAWGFTTLGVTGLVALGQDYDEARMLVMLLVFIVFLVTFCWAFAAASVVRVWAVLAGGGALMTATAWLVQRSLV